MKKLLHFLHYVIFIFLISLIPIFILGIIHGNFDSWDDFISTLILAFGISVLFVIFYLTYLYIKNLNRK